MKPNRNDPCPCGSGKKYKHCCERKIMPRPVLPAIELKQLNMLFNSGQRVEVIAQAQLLLEQYPDEPMLWELLATSLPIHEKAALMAFQKTAELLPNDAGAYYNLGIAFKNHGQLEQAVASYRRALAIKPNFVEVLCNLGNLLHDTHQIDDAVHCYRHALKLNPNLAFIHNSLGVALQDFGYHGTAIASHRRAIEIQPDYFLAHSNLLFALNYTKCSHTDYLWEARQYGQNVAKKVTARFAAWQCNASPQKLRVGIVSGDLHSHSVGHFAENLLAQLDNTRLELIAYTNSPKEDDLTRRIKPHFAHWREIYAL
ncbi:MAG: tetratricopeptide repeat protein, partial [Gallionella sp.]